MSTPDYFNVQRNSRPSAAPLRPSLSDVLSVSSPRTPNFNRSLSSHYGSPGSFRIEEDLLVYSFGSRHLRVGIAGEDQPRCILSFGPEQSRRVGDYRRWTPEFDNARRKGKGAWSSEWELWDDDLRETNLGLVSDKIERCIREALLKYLLLDPKTRKAVVVVPPCLPNPLLKTVLKTLFMATHVPNVTIMTPPVPCAVSAGLRAALVIDIGWRETVITAVFEYMEIHQQRSIRACKILSQEVARLLDTVIADARRKQGQALQGTEFVSFEEAEDVMTRMCWCRPSSHTEAKDLDRDIDLTISIPIPKATPPLVLEIPFSHLSNPAETTFLTADMPSKNLDIHDLPLPLLAYNTLLTLPIDVRAVCMSRILITGGGANIPGIKTRLVHDVTMLVSQRGWDPVKNYGSASAKRGKNPQQRSANFHTALEPPEPSNAQGEGNDCTAGVAQQPQPLVLASQTPQAPDHILDKLYGGSKAEPPPVKGVVRGVETLGAWTGASLIASLKIKGLVEIERDDFLKHPAKTLAAAGLL
ncbi:hypothetical protein LTR66_001740 [Elasticomyces elasticus]|nr:hypothetical protein LTR66_001740 [Elasticomyces elasticus]KAK5002910.1 hypothetical protein LTR28_010835 [Elasticomyces elasticus]